MAHLKATNYNDLLDVLNGRSSVKIGNNTWAEMLSGGVIGIRLHNTIIVELSPDGPVKFTTGGWNTVTTRERINQFLPGNHRVHTVKHELRLDGEPVGEFDWTEVPA